MSPDGGPGSDLLESREPATAQLRALWSLVSPRRRRLAAGAAAVVALIFTGWLGVTQARSWLHERDVRDQVSLTATVEVSASSTSLGGGRVDYFLAVRNAGPRQVRVSGAELSGARLHIVSRNFTALVVPPGTTVDVPLSVRLDCVRLGSAGAGSLHAKIVATPENGRERKVPTPLAQTTLVTDVADTLCSVQPDLRGRELSGSVS